MRFIAGHASLRGARSSYALTMNAGRIRANWTLVHCGLTRTRLSACVKAKAPLRRVQSTRRICALAIEEWRAGALGRTPTLRALTNECRLAMPLRQRLSLYLQLIRWDR